MTSVQKLTRRQVASLREALKVSNRMDEKMRLYLEGQGWKFEDYSMTKRYKDYHIYVEFCIGDFCVSLGSKNKGWLLEPKKRCDNFTEAFIETFVYQARIDSDEHWTGEDD